MDLENQNSPHRSLSRSPCTSFDSDTDANPLLKSKEYYEETGHESRGLDPRIISDATIGLSDGLTVPFALTAGLSALGSTKVVIFGGLAELIAGAISMGVGGYLGANSEADSYNSKYRSTQALIQSSPGSAIALIREAMSPYDFPEETIAALSDHLSSSQHQQLDFIMKFHHALQPPSCNRAYVSALTIALGYFVGGFIPLVPYFFASDIGTALWWSVGVMAVALFTFGFLKRALVEAEEDERVKLQRRIIKRTRSGVEMVFLGGIAAGAAMALVRVLAHE